MFCLLTIFLTFVGLFVARNEENVNVENGIRASSAYTHKHNFVLKHLQYRRLPLNPFGLVRLVASHILESNSGIKTVTVVFNTAFRIE